MRFRNRLFYLRYRECALFNSGKHLRRFFRGRRLIFLRPFLFKERLEKLGYTVQTNLGNKNNRISLAIYDEKLDKYLVGVELDRHAFAASDSSLERDVYKPRFLASRGWSIVRVWCRDWWLYPTKVIKTITGIAEKNREAVNAVTTKKRAK